MAVARKHHKKRISIKKEKKTETLRHLFLFACELQRTNANIEPAAASKTIHHSLRHRRIMLTE